MLFLMGWLFVLSNVMCTLGTKPNTMKTIVITIHIALLMLVSCSDEISQWRGPNRDGIYPGKDLVKEWAEGGPQLKLKIDNIGKGYSHPVVYKNKIYVSGIKRDSM